MQYSPSLDGNTRLHWLAISPKNYRVLQFVLSKMPQSDRIAAVNTRNVHGQTPLHAACSSQNVQAISLLSKSGAMNVRDNAGKKPYDFIAESLARMNE